MDKKYLWELYDAYLLGMIITINIFFGIFVFMPSDLSPNFALLFCSMPIIVLQSIKLCKNEKTTNCN